MKESHEALEHEAGAGAPQLLLQLVQHLMAAVVGFRVYRVQGLGFRV